MTVSFSRSLRWQAALLMGLAGGGAMVVWTLPNFPLFWQALPHLEQLWHDPLNRRPLLSLFLRVVSPLFVLELLALALWFVALLREMMPRESTRAVTPVLSSPPMPSIEEQEPFWEYLVPSSLPAVSLERVRDTPPALSRVEEERSATPITGSPENGMVVGESPAFLIRLLKDVGLSLCLPDGTHKSVPLLPNVKQLSLLAFLASSQGREGIPRDQVLERIFGWGLPDEEADEERLAERFEAAKKALRRQIRRVVHEVNQGSEEPLLDPDLDKRLLVSEQGFWKISPLCLVEDLSCIEHEYQIIEQARKAGHLDQQSIPETVKVACERLIAAYSGDFLDTVLKTYPREFRAFDGRSSWVKKPFTRYRDSYLEALWVLAQAEEQQGQRSQAAEHYQTYALHACNSRFDAKVFFRAHEQSVRVEMSERAIRRCVEHLSVLGKTDRVAQIWATYTQQMKQVSDQRWSPSETTREAVQAAKAVSSAHHRLPT